MYYDVSLCWCCCCCNVVINVTWKTNNNIIEFTIYISRICCKVFKVIIKTITLQHHWVYNIFKVFCVVVKASKLLRERRLYNNSIDLTIFLLCCCSCKVVHRRQKLTTRGWAHCHSISTKIKINCLYKINMFKLYLKEKLEHKNNNNNSCKDNNKIQ